MQAQEAEQTSEFLNSGKFLFISNTRLRCSRVSFVRVSQSSVKKKIIQWNSHRYEKKMPYHKSLLEPFICSPEQTISLQLSGAPAVVLMRQ